MNRRTFFKISLVTALCVIFPWIAFATPYIVCDPYPNNDNKPTEFLLQIDSGSWVSSAPQVLGDGTVRLHYDIGSVTNGSHTVNIKAKNIWGESAAVPFSFAKGVPGGATNIKLEP